MNYQSTRNHRLQASSAAAVLESTVTHNRENIQRAEAELAEAESRSGGLAKQAEEQEALLISKGYPSFLY